METVAKRLYEGMFLVDSAQAAADWEGTLSVIDNILKRADAEVVSMQKWQERKLAYEIDHKTRGTYILCYFNTSGERIAGIEKDVLLSEKVMRVLILGTEKRPPEMIEADIKGDAEEKAPGSAAPAEPKPETPAPAPTPTPAAETTEEAAPEKTDAEAPEPASTEASEPTGTEAPEPASAEASQAEPAPADDGTEKTAE